MAKLVLNETKNFKNIIDSVEKVLEEIKIMVDNDGLRFRGLSKSHVCFTNVEFKSTYFDDFECPIPQTWYLDTNELLKIFKRVKSSDVLEITNDESTVTFKFIGDSERVFKIKMLDEEYSSQELPNISFPFDNFINFKEFKESVKDVNLYSDKIRLKTENNCLFLSSENDFVDYKAKLDLLNECEDDYKVIVNISWLEMFFKIGEIGDLNIKFGNNIPLLLKMSDSGSDVKIIYLIAPIIEEND